MISRVIPSSYTRGEHIQVCSQVGAMMGASTDYAGPVAILFVHGCVAVEPTRWCGSPSVAR